MSARCTSALEAVREAKGDPSVQLIDHLKKPDMAREAERLLAGTGWLPEPLRTPVESAVQPDAEAATESPPAFLAGEGDGTDEQTPSDPEEAQSPAIAAE
jgi:ParB family transcriptional regulator, chromosome partitioning protein